jgi:hypothetical protein
VFGQAVAAGLVARVLSDTAGKLVRCALAGIQGVGSVVAMARVRTRKDHKGTRRDPGGFESVEGRPGMRREGVEQALTHLNGVNTHGPLSRFNFGFYSGPSPIGRVASGPAAAVFGSSSTTLQTLNGTAVEPTNNVVGERNSSRVADAQQVLGVSAQCRSRRRSVQTKKLSPVATVCRKRAMNGKVYDSGYGAVERVDDGQFRGSSIMDSSSECCVVSAK